MQEKLLKQPFYFPVDYSGVAGYNTNTSTKKGGIVLDADRRVTCCFTGHRPAKLPWGYDERDPRCLALKRSLLREAEGLYLRGYRRFICGMALGCDLYFAEAVLELKERYPAALLEAALPFSGQAARWAEHQRARWQGIVERCDRVTLLQEHYDRGCMLRRDRYMVDRSSAVLAVFDDSPGGTKYTLDYAAGRRLDILLLSVDAPQKTAVRMESDTFCLPTPLQLP